MDAGDAICSEDAILRYPWCGERFRDRIRAQLGFVTHETQYFAGPFPAPESRR
ncbi:hypothetical protein AB0F91_11915 [Amycolatopsis sp. NPDC023774]|uniref:hypothetical protein n=1 Tax=Amycolatopsis sp. NPDC023774 TaxID=3155015 RepID=UPI0033D6686C